MAKALIVDDDRVLAEAMAYALEMVGIEVEKLIQSDDAIARIAETKPDAVFLDVQMPRVSGIDILKAVRGDENLADVKVILVTANSYVMQDVEVTQMADLILLKPIQLDQIVNFAKRMVDA